MPKKEFYGAQPPIELIRQWMDHAGWYDRLSKEKSWMTIQDIIFVSAMGPPGGGRSFITPRLLRHYNIVTYTNLGGESISMIFRTILGKFLGNFDAEVSSSIDKLVEST
jgi:dynein heavy chain